MPQAAVVQARSKVVGTEISVSKHRAPFLVVPPCTNVGYLQGVNCDGWAQHQQENVWGMA